MPQRVVELLSAHNSPLFSNFLEFLDLCSSPYLGVLYVCFLYLSCTPPCFLLRLNSFFFFPFSKEDMIFDKCADKVLSGHELEVWKPALAAICNEVKLDKKED